MRIDLTRQYQGTVSLQMLHHRITPLAASHPTVGTALSGKGQSPPAGLEHFADEAHAPTASPPSQNTLFIKQAQVKIQEIHTMVIFPGCITASSLLWRPTSRLRCVSATGHSPGRGGCVVTVHPLTFWHVHFLFNKLSCSLCFSVTLL